ncbi:hypothetical protein diail_9953 [Diaporthe ilicicola]|nr:hypothetical protein diail_9953 [Diaporthe ilicicola]
MSSSNTNNPNGYQNGHQNGQQNAQQNAQQNGQQNSYQSGNQNSDHASNNPSSNGQNGNSQPRGPPETNGVPRTFVGMSAAELAQWHQQFRAGIRDRTAEREAEASRDARN